MGKSLIYLTGFMGSGKSTIGPILAEVLGANFFDVDELIERRLGKSIAQIFKEEGEAFFRTVESEILREISLTDNAVVSLGGGTILNPYNMELVKATGILVWLFSEPEEIMRRVGESDRRVLLEKREEKLVEEEQIYRRIETLLEIRQPFYQTADFLVDTTGKSVEEIVREIVIEVGKRTKLS